MAFSLCVLMQQATLPAAMSYQFLARYPDALARSYSSPPLGLPTVRHAHAREGGVDVLVPMDTGAAPDPAPAQAFAGLHPPSLLHGGWDPRQPVDQAPRIASNVQGDFAERLVRHCLERLAEEAAPLFLVAGVDFGPDVKKGMKKVRHLAWNPHICNLLQWYLI